MSNECASLLDTAQHQLTLNDSPTNIFSEDHNLTETDLYDVLE